MSDEKKVNIKQWATFAFSVITIIGKMVMEIIDLLPKKNA